MKYLIAFSLGHDELLNTLIVQLIYSFMNQLSS